MTIGEEMNGDVFIEKNSHEKHISIALDLEPGRTFARIKLELLMPNHPDVKELETKFRNLMKLLVK